MFEHMSNNPVEFIKYIVMIVLAVVCFVLYKNTKTDNKVVFGSEKEENRLKNEFKNIDKSFILNYKDDYRLTLGICIGIQGELEKSSKPSNAFEGLSSEKRNALVIGYLFEDSKSVLSNFFRSNKEPILSASKNAVNEIFDEEYASFFNDAYNLFDENNEENSVEEDKVLELNTGFNSYMKSNSEAVYRRMADYIRSNAEKFIV